MAENLEARSLQQSHPIDSAGTAATGICCARQEDGRVVYVQAVPMDLQDGVVLRCILNDLSPTATVSIPPALLIHIDPTISLVTFDAVLSESHTVTTPAVAAEPLELVLWEGGAPPAQMLAWMLNLASSESGRLDDPGDYPEPKHDGPRSSDRRGRSRRR